MRLLGRMHPEVMEIRADEVEKGQHLAASRYQSFSMRNVRAGEEVVSAVQEDDKIYIVGSAYASYAWTLAPEDIVMIEKEN